MVAEATRPQRDKPWHQYRREPQHRLLEPGWPGSVGDDELVYIQERLKSDDSLSYWWGFRPGMKRRSAAAIERVAMHGDPDNRSHNVKLVREFSRRAQEGNEGDSPKVKQSINPAPARPGRSRIESWESELLRMASLGMGLKSIAKALRGQGVQISHTTVATRLRELQGQLRLIS